MKSAIKEALIGAKVTGIEAMPNAEHIFYTVYLTGSNGKRLMVHALRTETSPKGLIEVQEGK